MAFKLPRFDRNIEIVSDAKTASLVFHHWWQETIKRIETAITDVQTAQAAAAAAQTAANTAQTSANTAQTAANTAQTAATTAQTAANSAQTTANSVTTVAKLSNSGVTGCTLTATDAGSNVTISITAHTRTYADGAAVSVNSGSLTALAYSTTYYIYYDQASFAGGAVTYVSTTTQTTAAQTGNRHFVGEVTTPAAAAPATNGRTPRIPGFGNLD